MASKRIHRPDLTGQRFGRLTVLRETDPYLVPSGKGTHRRWLCRCDCGNETVGTTCGLRNGAPKSCGCLWLDACRAAKTTHGAYGTPEHISWRAMRNRCLNPNGPGFDLYGGRGITICERWNDFANFLADMGPKPTPRHSIERVDPDGNYEPRNCRWATLREQCFNKRTSRLVEYRGRLQCLSQWANELGFQRKTLEARLKSGWSVERALTTPLRRWPK